MKQSTDQLASIRRSGFELLSDEEIFKEWDNAKWMCECPEMQTGLFHCQDCKAEPPGGCRCVYCNDLITLREAENESAKRKKG